MGSLQAQEMAELVDLDTALTWQLRANHYPPVPYEMIAVCKEAIQAVNDYDEEREIELPIGVSWRGQNTTPAYEIARAFHLEPWITRED